MQNTPGHKAEGVVCKLGGYSEPYTTTSARVQYLAQRGIPQTRAALLAPFAFGEAA